MSSIRQTVSASGAIRTKREKVRLSVKAVLTRSGHTKRSTSRKGGMRMCEKCKKYRKKYKRFKRKFLEAKCEAIALEYKLNKAKKAGGDNA
jgi:hypothetical protein